ncbi:acetyltransferase [Photobacterium sanguinicancri]|uniref:Acetyltransferase n=1 Tax=Photobacterium sanguinicancri TaxID=875932 RepID=A0AAW7Y671_9GAMM|nr:acetyltransferase [Photobacterium sanguinicancri]MDO6542477.1 acetyltransferase [Photobacterium sanguinicancri]
MKTLAILGASGHGKVVADIAESTGWDEIVFFDDNWPSITCVEGWEVIGTFADLLLSQISSVFVAIGDGNTRYDKLRLLEGKNKTLETIIHPSSIISKYACVGAGSIICEGAVIKAFSKVGMANIINSNATIGHDCLIGDACHISLSTSIAGNVSIGFGSWVGNSASIRQNITIGQNVMIGTGSVVVKDVDANFTVVGNPASQMISK